MGSLEDIRKTLHLSRRKMCQMMLVDPTSWTRRTRDESKVPQHILKALQWNMLLVEKYPSLHPQHKIGMQNDLPRQESDGLSARQLEQMNQQKRVLEQKVQDLEGHLQSHVSELSQNPRRTQPSGCCLGRCFWF